MPKRKKDDVPILRVKDTDDLATIYAKARRAFTAADLQKYTEIEVGIPVEQVLAEMETIHREVTKKKNELRGTGQKRKRKKA